MRLLTRLRRWGALLHLAGFLLWLLFVAGAVGLGLALHAAWANAAVMWPFAVAYGLACGLGSACWDALVARPEGEAE